ncbi:MAG: DUF2125 domain-containing protein [Rhodobacteraceae bacterium]|nr:DUF2125 domain-containing protein [Paracoccaceae bacterium]
MTQRTALCGTTAILIALGGAAQADVTAAEVWENWKSAGESMGQVLTPGSESQDGGTLTINDLQIGMELPEAAVTGGIDQLVFSQNGDGTVSVAMSQAYTMSVDVSAEDVLVDLSISHEGLDIVASGDPGAITYDMFASRMDIAVDSLEVDGEQIELTAEISTTDVGARYVVVQGDMTEVDTAFKAAGLTVLFRMKEPGGGDGHLNADATLSDIEGTSSGSLVFLADPEALSQALKDGLSTASAMSHGGSSYSLEFVDGSDQFSINGSSTGGHLAVSMDAEALAYEVASSGVDLTMSGSEIPLPEIALTMGEFGMAFLMPVAASEEPGAFGFNFTLRDLSVSEMIWSMVDAGGQLPHDPATLIIDLAGQANWLFDIFDPESMAELDGPMPGEIHALDIKELKLTIAGADLSGNGAFTFDNANLMTFNGAPAPTGALDLQLVGGNGLLDKLVAMGLLPEDQAMGARMMMGLFARPGDGEDTLNTKIEVDGATGAVSANGQRLQ